MMSKVRDKKAYAGEIQLLTFNIGGMEMGMDMEDVLSISEPQKAAALKIRLFNFADMIDLGTGEYVCTSPKILVVKDEDGSAGIMIEAPEDIITVKTESISELPMLIRGNKGTGPIWGAALKNNKIILLIDTYKLISGVSKEARTC